MKEKVDASKGMIVEVAVRHPQPTISFLSKLVKPAAKCRVTLPRTSCGVPHSCPAAPGKPQAIVADCGVTAHLDLTRVLFAIHFGETRMLFLSISVKIVRFSPLLR